jgi:ech hydrogenase subunit A
MFLAPFGMLISKYAVLRALVDVNPILAVLIAFGSATTLFFWVKWMGKIVTVLSEASKITSLEKEVSVDEWLPLYTLAGATIVVCAFFPVFSHMLVQPYVNDIYGYVNALGSGNITIMSIMMGLVLLFPLSFLFYDKKAKVVNAFLSGANVGDSYTFTDSLGNPKTYNVRNYYMESFFGEAKLFNAGAVLTVLVLAAMFFVGK